MVCPVTNCLPSIRIAASTPARIKGVPPLLNNLFRLPESCSSLGLSWVNLPVINKPHAAALTNIDGLRPKCFFQLPSDNLSWINLFRVSTSGIRKSASARHINATPSSLDSVNSCIKASTPLALLRSARTFLTNERANLSAAIFSLSDTLARAIISFTASTSSRR